MGVLTRASNIGPLNKTEGFEDYESDCWEFLKLQIALQKPRVIVVLGKAVVQTLSPTNRLGISAWNLGKNQAFGPVRNIAHQLHLGSAREISDTLVVAAYHPSYGRSAKQIAGVKEDSRFVASILEG
jgi:uracil-DNA glycosylase